MSYPNRSLTILLLLLFSISLAAQVKPSKMVLQKKMKHLKNLSEKNIQQDQFFKAYQTQLGLSDQDQMNLSKEISGANGYAHYKYEQFYKGVAVYASAYTLHIKNGTVYSAGGYYLPLLDIDVKPSIKAGRAQQIAIEEMAKLHPFAEVAPTASSKPRLVIVDKAYPKASEAYALAYEVAVENHYPYDKKRLFIDAQTGNLLLELSLLKHQSVPVPATGVTKYYGIQTFVVDSVGPTEFHLIDKTRGEYIETTNRGNTIEHDSNDWDIGNENQDEVAIDAHYCASRFYDFLIDKFDWSGLDGAGKGFLTHIHGGSYVNASWNGERASFGDGGCNHGPLTTLEVVAHEFTHGITDYTADLVYQGQSGAINESMSDVLGTALEYYEDYDNFDWFIGTSFITSALGEPFRSMEDPHLYDDPKMIGGQNWNESAGVHTNSSIGNYWFHLLVEGGTGVNEAGYNYNVNPIGMDKAMQIPFLCLKAYLTSESIYQDYYEVSLQATEELYGADSPELATVIEAWKVVGLPTELAADKPKFNMTTLGLVNTCIADDYYTVEVEITNISNQTYEPSMNGTAKLTDQNITIPIDSTIAPGEVFILRFVDAYYFEETTSEFTAIRIESNPNFDVANTAFLSLYNYYYAENDLSLSVSIDDETNCGDDWQRVRFTVRNESCTDIPEDTPYQIVLTTVDGEILFSENYTLPFNLETRRTRSVYEDIEMTFPVNTSLNTVLVYEPDVFPDNNTTTAIYYYHETITEDYHENFDAIDVTDYKTLKFDGLLDFDNVTYEGEQYLAMRSRYVNSPEFCLDLEDMLEANNFSFGAGVMDLCVDVPDMLEPVLEFDLIQFRTAPALDNSLIVDHTNIVKVSWEIGDSTASQIITGQAEGELYHYEIPLPSAYQGQISFQFLCATGNNNLSAFADYDATLLDNLSISELPTVDTKEVDQDAKISVYPNPSEQLFYVNYDRTPDLLRVLNISGQEVLRLNPKADQEILDLSTFLNGYYMLSLSYENHETINLPLVKIE